MGGEYNEMGIWENDMSGLNQMKQKERDVHVAKTLKWLDQNKIQYTETKIPNIVKIKTLKKKDVFHLSLNAEQNLFKVRFDGRGKWYTYKKDKLLKLIIK
jgi:hypothetical protein